MTYISKLSIAPGGLPAPFADGRPAGSALYFLMTSQAPVKLHHIRNEQLYHHYLGDPIEVLMLHDDGTHTFATVGPDLRAGQVVQLRIPGNTFHTAQIRGARPNRFSAAAPNGPASSSRSVDSAAPDELAGKQSDVAAEIPAASLCRLARAANSYFPRRSCRRGRARRARSRCPAHGGKPRKFTLSSNFALQVLKRLSQPAVMVKASPTLDLLRHGLPQLQRHHAVAL